MERLSIKTGKRVEFQDVTAQVKSLVAASGIKDGLCVVYVPHTTAAVMINEHADPDVVEDIMSHLDATVPQQRHYRHAEGNSPAHIKASLIGTSQTIIVEGGQLVLGTWQGIFFCEFDGPRSRSLYVKMVPAAF